MWDGDNNVRGLPLLGFLFHNVSYFQSEKELGRLVVEILLSSAKADYVSEIPTSLSRTLRHWVEPVCLCGFISYISIPKAQGLLS